MANSKYEYVKCYEKTDILLPTTYIVVRIDGRSFHKVSRTYEFVKPNDRRALNLMNAAATALLKEIPEIFIAYGTSDEFSFVFDKECRLFERRENKIVTTVVSTFTSNYVFLWPTYFPTKPLSPPLPTFDGRAILYPNEKLLRDYLSWRQVDCHINNLYNTTFWALVNIGGISLAQAESDLKGTSSADKNEILFSTYKINYNDEAEIFKRGSTVYRIYDISDSSTSVEFMNQERANGNLGSKAQMERAMRRRSKMSITVEHTDLIKDHFWEERPWLLPGTPIR